MSLFFCKDTKDYWESCICLIDMVAFFASVEQLDYPELRGKAIGITNGVPNDGATIITSSYKAREFGIKTGTKIRDALVMCPDIIIRPSRPERYAALSKKIMTALNNDISPDQEIFSIDETFLDLTGVLRYFGSVRNITYKICESVFMSSGLRCSVGVSTGKLTAKYAASLGKGKITIIKPKDVEYIMGEASISDICGIGKRTTQYLNKHNVYKGKDLRKFPMSILAKKFGDHGRRLYLTCTKGIDPYPVIASTPDPKSIGHSKVLPPYTTNKELVRGIMRRLTERLSARLRDNHLVSDLYSIYFKTKDKTIEKKYKTLTPINNTSEIWDIVHEHFLLWKVEPLFKVGINAINLKIADESTQLDMFCIHKNKSQELIDYTKDEINKKFGKHSLQSATELFTKNANMTPVISFNYQPTGAKKSI